MSVNRNKLNWEWRLTATTSIGQKNRLNSFTPLQIASWLSNTRAASLLLQRGVLLDLPDHFGSTPLHSATYTGKTDAITLLRAGANPNIQDVNGETLAYAAAQLGHLTTLQILVKTAPIYAAAKKGNLNTIQFLLAHGGRIQTLSNTGNSVLHAVLLASNEAMHNWVVDYVTVYHQRSREDGTVLNMLYLQNSIAAIEKMFLVPRSADAKLAINDFSEAVPPALVDAAAAGYVKAPEILLDQSADIEICWRHLGTALMAAYSHGRLRAVQLLVSRGAQLSFLGSDGPTFNAIGQAKNDPDIVKWLRETRPGQGYLNPADNSRERTDEEDEPVHHSSVKSLRRRNSLLLDP